MSWAHVSPHTQFDRVRMHEGNRRVLASLHSDWGTGSDETVSTVVSLATRIEAWSDAPTAILTEGTVAGGFAAGSATSHKRMSKMPARPEPRSANALQCALRPLSMFVPKKWTP